MLVFVGICIAQLLRPTVAGWSAILVLLGLSLWPLVLDISAQLGDYGSGDHGAFEGWGTFSVSSGVAGLVTLLLIAIAWNFPRRASNRDNIGQLDDA